MLWICIGMDLVGVSIPVLGDVQDEVVARCHVANIHVLPYFQTLLIFLQTRHQLLQHVFPQRVNLGIGMMKQHGEEAAWGGGPEEDRKLLNGRHHLTELGVKRRLSARGVEHHQSFVLHHADDLADLGLLEELRTTGRE